VDRPNLSKDYLAGTAPEEWIPLRGAEFYKEQGIELMLANAATDIDTSKRTVILSSGRVSYNTLILATGAEAIRLPIPGANLPHVYTLRSLADSRAIIKRIGNAKRVALVGASFIALEAAAALRTRGIEVHLIAPEARPLERVLGPELGSFVQSLHEEHGAIFHLGHTLKSIETDSVTLDDGSSLPADVVIVGIGVRPLLALAEKAGAKLDRGVLVNEFLETSVPGVYAAGDIARFPDRSGQMIRVEHWVVAEQQGQIAARNALGLAQPFSSIPFFWSQHYDVPIAYVGHAEKWDSIQVTGNIAERNCLVAYRSSGKVLAVASIYRDVESLAIEEAMERDDQSAIDRILKA